MCAESVRLPPPTVPRSSTWVGVLALALGVVVASGWTRLHVRLESSSPSSGAVLAAAPVRFELRFSGAVEASLSAATLHSPSGDSVSLVLEASRDDARVLIANAPGLGAGHHVLRWRTVSADGHLVRGEIQFTIAPPADIATDDEAPADVSADRLPAGEVSPAPSGEGEGGPAVGTALLAGLALACLLAFAGLLWHVGAGALLTEPAVRRATLLFGWGALILLSAELALWLRAARVPGGGADSLWAGLLSRSGNVSLLRIGLLASALLVLRKRGRAAALLASAALMIGAAAGHAAAIDAWITMPANAVHLGAVAIWAGGLLLLVLLPDITDLGHPGPTDWSYRGVAGAVSAASLLAVVLVAASGMIQSLLFVGDLEAYTATRYGRLLLLKWAGLAVLIGFGAWHRFRVLPPLLAEAEADPALVKQSVRVEAVVMLLVVLVAAYLAHVPAPAGH